MKKSIFSLAILSTIGVSRLFAQQPGDLDPTFNGNGKVVTNFGPFSTEERAYAMAIQSDGKIVAAGYTWIGTEVVFAAGRYNLNGSLDSTFGGDGKVTTAIGTDDDRAYTVAIQPDGKIVLGGETSLSTTGIFALIRYNSDGTLDSSFGTNGMVTTAIGVYSDEIHSIAIQPDGKIVAVGTTNNGSNDDIALTRYNTDGALDNTFSSDGKQISNFSIDDDMANSVAIQTDGKIVIGGSTYTPYGDFAVARYDTSGNLDNTFDGDGLLVIYNSVGGEGKSVVIQSDNKIVIAGQDSTGFSVVRLNLDGTLDSSFGSSGIINIVFGSAYSVALQTDGKILVAGAVFNNLQNENFALARYNSDGSLDSSFSADGKVTTDIYLDGEDYAYAVALEPDGKIVLAGETWLNGITGFNFAIARYVITCTQTTFYADADHDGFGNLIDTVHACTQPSGYVANSTDCNDANPNIHPGVIEICNGIDDNCNGQIDEGVQLTFYTDADGDGYGNSSIDSIACSSPTGYVEDSTDCNDADPNIHPGAIEIPNNGIDDDCDGLIDEICGASFYLTPDTLLPHHYWAINQAAGIGSLTYLWSWGDGTYDSIALPSHIYAAANFYTICLTIHDSTGCTDSTCINYDVQKLSAENTIVKVDVVDSIPSFPTNIQNTNVLQSWSVFPNPASGNSFINYTLSTAATVGIALYDVLGNKLQQVVNGIEQQGEHNATIDARKLANGVYVLQIRADEQMVRRTPDSFGAEEKIVVMN